MTLLFTGAAPAVTTPFKNGEVDFDSFEKHLTFLKENGAQAFIINGTTGESSTMTKEEEVENLKLAVEIANGEIPVIAGTGSNSTVDAIEYSLLAQNAGVDGLLQITPYYNKTTQAGAVAHFTAIADAVELPIILYDVPARTGMTLAAETVAELAKHPNIVGLKDATGDLTHLVKMIHLVDDEDFAFYSGNDDLALPFYSVGGHGIISVIGNVIPRAEQKLYELAQTQPKEAVKLNRQLFPLVEIIGADLNPLGVKALVSHLGFCDYEFRLPLVGLEADRVAEIIEVYESVKKGLNV